MRWGVAWIIALWYWLAVSKRKSKRVVGINSIVVITIIIHIGKTVLAGDHNSHQLVDKLPSGDLYQEMLPAVFDALVDELQSQKLDIGVAVLESAFEVAHSVFGADAFALDKIRDFKIQSQILLGRGNELARALIYGGKQVSVEISKAAEGHAIISVPTSVTNSS
jgi:hypothetical protein